MKFDRYYISAEIKKNLEQLGFNRPTDIQFRSIPSILNDEDVLAVAQTGTGKTAAFAIPVIDKIHRMKSSKRSYGIKCIVMVPTRELALQIGEVFKSLCKHTKVKTFTLHGGIEQDSQIAKLQDGIDVLIATPGRMFDLINQEVLRISSVNTLVLDEADHMLDLGFIEDIKYIKKMLTQRHQTLFFSATFNDEIRKLAYSQVKSAAIRIQISPKDPVAKNVSHFVMFVEMDDKRFFLERFIKENPESRIIVFVRTRVRAERVAKAMARVGIDSLAIHGEKDQQQRAEAMQQFRDGKCNILIATDVSARGIDVPDVNYVINYDLPEKCENYVHRVGRTGRGVKRGAAISLCSEEERDVLGEIETFLGKPIDVMKVGKKAYAMTVETLAIAAPDREKESLRTLVAEHDAWLNKPSAKKRKVKNKNRTPKSKK
jgi:ATP-dependent RNA helicase RhlE